MDKGIFLKVITVGDLYSGKTSLINRYIKNEFSTHHCCTIGAGFKTQRLVIDDKPLTMSIWDTAGQEKFEPSMGLVYYRGTDCCILCFDTTNIKSFERLEYWKKQFEDRSALKSIKDGTNNFPMILIGNKIDLSKQRVISIEMAELWCKQNGNLKYFDVSAKDGTNVNDAFLAAAKIALDQFLLTRDENGKLKPIVVESTPQSSLEQKKVCCYSY